MDNIKQLIDAIHSGDTAKADELFNTTVIEKAEEGYNAVADFVEQHFFEEKMAGKDPCWKGYKMLGTKKGKGGKDVPNCIPEETVQEVTAIGKFMSKIKTKLADKAKEKEKKDAASSLKQTVDAYMSVGQKPNQMKESISEEEYNALSDEEKSLYELSKETLGSYIKSATASAISSKSLSKEFEMDSNAARNKTKKAGLAQISNDFRNKTWKRMDGISKATDKLVKKAGE